MTLPFLKSYKLRSNTRYPQNPCRRPKHSDFAKLCLRHINNFEANFVIMLEYLSKTSKWNVSYFKQVDI